MGPGGSGQLLVAQKLTPENLIPSNILALWYEKTHDLYPLMRMDPAQLSTKALGGPLASFVAWPLGGDGQQSLY